eukprot:343697_1
MEFSCFVLVFIQTTFFAACGVSVALTGLQSYNYYKQNITQYRSLWYFALATFLCVTLSCLTAAIFTPILTYTHTINLCPLFYMIQAVLSSIFKINLYLFFLQRIHDTFQFSLHEIQPIIINSLRFLTVSYWISITALQCALVYPNSHIAHIGVLSYCDLHQDRIQFNVDLILISDTISETILCPLILILFIRGLYSVVSTRKTLSIRDVSKSIHAKSPTEAQTQFSHDRSRSETVSEDGYDYNNKMDRSFVYAMTKFTTLANVSFITSIAVYLLLLICKYVSLQYVLSIQLAIRLVFDQWINCFCVYFVFRFTNAKYHKYCKYPHKLQICCMVWLCPTTKPMFEVAKLEYQQNKLGLKGYSSRLRTHQMNNNTVSSPFSTPCEDELEIVHEQEDDDGNSKTENGTMDDMVQLIDFEVIEHADSMDDDDDDDDNPNHKISAWPIPYNPY